MLALTMLIFFTCVVPPYLAAMKLVAVVKRKDISDVTDTEATCTLLLVGFIAFWVWGWIVNWG